MSDSPIIREKNEIMEQEDAPARAAKRKVLNVTVDIDGILAALMQCANIEAALSQIDPSLEYVVQIPVKYMEALEAGDLFLNQNSKTGVLWPTLYEMMGNGKRKFVDNLPIKQEEIVRGNPFESVAISYHNLYMQQQIIELADSLQETYQAVRRIEQGQMDDRIGLLSAGKDQIRYSLNAPEEERIAEMAQGRNSMLIAQKQILQTFKSRVRSFEPIPEIEWLQLFMEIRYPGFYRRKDQEFSEIQKYYALYLQATQLIAASYAMCGQTDIAEQVYIDAEQEMKDIDFGALKTLQNIHKKNSDMFYNHAEEYIAAEKEICLEGEQDYDAISVQVSGEKLLEVFGQ